MDMAQATFAALERSPAQQSRLAQSLPSNEVTAQFPPNELLADAVGRNLNDAVVAFENASGTTRLASLVEPVSDVEVFRLLGDALYALGAAASARTAYAQAVDRFFEAWEPVEQVPPVTETLAHWAAVLIDIMTDAGACESETIPDPAWTERWHQLGDTPPDLCRLAKHDNDTEKPPLLPNIKKMFRHTVKCYEEPVSDTADHPNATWKRRFEMLNCYDLSGAKVRSMWLQLSAEVIEAEIAHALGGQR